MSIGFENITDEIIENISTESVVVRLKYSKPCPTFLGLGIISSSASDDTPEPNNNSTLLSSRTLDTNLLAVLFNLRIYGTVDLYSDNSGSLNGIFAISSNTVSCAK